MSCAVFGLRIIVLCLVLLSAPGAFAETIARIVAAVNNDVITSIDLEQAARLNEFLTGGGQDRGRLLAETRDGLVTRLLLLQEARRLRFVELTGAESTAEVEALASRFGASALKAFLENNGMSLRDLERMLGEQLLVKRFIEKKIALFIRISREEAEQYFERHAREFGARNFAEVQKEITALLWSRQLDARLEQYLAELRAKADIRTNPLPEGETGTYER